MYLAWRGVGGGVLFGSRFEIVKKLMFAPGKGGLILSAAVLFDLWGYILLVGGCLRGSGSAPKTKKTLHPFRKNTGCLLEKRAN